MIQNIYKDWLTTLIGTALMVFGLGSWFFSWPSEPNAMYNAVEAGLGLMLLFVDKQKIANALFGRFKKQVEK